MLRFISFCSVLFVLISCHPKFASSVEVPLAGQVVPQIQLSQKQIDEQNEIIMRAHSFKWLEGNWKRTNDEVGYQTYEEWVNITPIEFQGITYTVKNDTMVWEENSELKIEYEDNILRIKNVDREKIKFYCDVEGEENFVCSNSSDEYPHYIIYKMKGDTLFSSIEGGGPSVLFKYVKDYSPKR